MATGRFRWGSASATKALKPIRKVSGPEAKADSAQALRRMARSSKLEVSKSGWLWDTAERDFYLTDPTMRFSRTTCWASCLPFDAIARK